MTPWKNAELDAARRSFDGAGVHDFLWPVARETMVNFRNAACRSVVETVRNDPTFGSDKGDAGAAIALGVFMDALGLFQACAVRDAFSNQGHGVRSPDGRFRKFLEHGQFPDPHAFADRIYSGAAPKRRGLAYRIKPAAQTILWSHPCLLVKPWRWRNGKIVATKNSGLLHGHAGQRSTMVRYRPTEHWDGLRTMPGRAQDAPLGAEAQAFADALAGRMSMDFNKSGIDCTEQATAYLRQLAGAAYAAASRRLEIMRQPAMAPTVWTGSAGNLGTRFIRLSARARGSHVVGHDHAPGIGHLRYDVKRLNDFVACDRFLTFTKAQATGLQKIATTGPLLQEAAPTIEHIPSSRGAMHQRPREPKSKRDPRSVIYASPYYNGDRVHYGLHLPDLVALDFEARLIGDLARRGLRVFYKPHPGSITVPSRSLLEKLGATVIDKPYESIMDRADVHVFSQTQATPFVKALAAGKPIVFIDLGLFDWHDNAYRALSRRCSIVRGGFDDTNRVRIDMDKLAAGIAESPFLTDSSFQEQYLGIGA